jgi:2,3-bisphosphoglycerate-independent phosphoglycerate mutase
MVGHTGHLEASTIAVEAVDLGLSRILPVVRAARGVLVVTADHGNADEMVEYDKKGEVKRDESGKPKSRTSHSLNPVPFHLIDFAGRSLALRGDLDDAGLSNIAATLIELLGYEAPSEYDPSLLERP